MDHQNLRSPHLFKYVYTVGVIYQLKNFVSIYFALADIP